MPAASLRIIPALSISLWLTSSASAGVSFSVWRWNCDRRIGGVTGVGARPGIVPCSTRAGPAGGSFAPAVDLDPVARLDVHGLVAAAAGRRVLGHVDHAGLVGPAVEDGRGRRLTVGAGGIRGGAGGVGRRLARG